MSRYLQHIKGKPTHERRLHAMRVSGVITALIFVGWVTTLGVSMGTGAGTVAQEQTDTQTASAVQSSGFTGNQLIVSTTTNY